MKKKDKISRRRGGSRVLIGHGLDNDLLLSSGSIVTRSFFGFVPFFQQTSNQITT